MPCIYLDSTFRQRLQRLLAGVVAAVDGADAVSGLVESTWTAPAKTRGGRAGMELRMRLPHAHKSGQNHSRTASRRRPNRASPGRIGPARRGIAAPPARSVTPTPAAPLPAGSPRQRGSACRGRQRAARTVSSAGHRAAGPSPPRLPPQAPPPCRRTGDGASGPTVLRRICDGAAAAAM
jgi:hypothetical protein